MKKDMDEKKGKGSGSNGEPQVRGVTLSWETHCEMKDISKASGMKMSDLYRLAIGRLVEEVRETGRLPLPRIEIMPVEGFDGKGDVA